MHYIYYICWGWTHLTKPLLTSDNYSIQNLHSHQDVTHHNTTSLPYHTLTYHLTHSLVPWISHSPGSHSLGSNNPGSAHSPVDLITTTITSLLSQYSGSTVSWIKSPYKPPVLYPHSLLDLLILLDRLSLLDLQSSGLHSSRSTILRDLHYTTLIRYTTLHYTTLH